MKLSIIIPAYNEGQNIPLLYKEIGNAISPLNLKFEIIFVNDGSSDNTYQQIFDLEHTDPFVKGIHLKQNQGQSVALFSGIRQASGELVAILDADLQNDPKDIPGMINLLTNNIDVICGWRKERKDNLLTTNLPSKIANWIIRWYFDIPFHDVGCSLKLCRRSALNSIEYFPNFHRYIPIILHNAGFSVLETTVNHRARQYGQSHYSILKSINVIQELVALKRLYTKEKKIRRETF